MSMSLALKTPEGEIIDFPFQTPTNFSKQVIAEPNDLKKILLIKTFLEEIELIEYDVLAIVSELRLKLHTGYKIVMM